MTSGGDRILQGSPHPIRGYQEWTPPQRFPPRVFRYRFAISGYSYVHLPKDERTGQSKLSTSVDLRARMLGLIEIAVAGRKSWLLSEKLNPRKSLVRRYMNPDLLLIENNSSAHCCLKGRRLLSSPSCSRKGGDAGGNRANHDCNSWRAGNNQQALADASAGTSRYRSPA